MNISMPPQHSDLLLDGTVIRYESRRVHIQHALENRRKVRPTTAECPVLVALSYLGDAGSSRDRCSRSATDTPDFRRRYLVPPSAER